MERVKNVTFTMVYKNEEKNMRKYVSIILLLLILFGCSTNRNKSNNVISQKPVVLKIVPPVYPESLNDKEITGEVWVNVEILTDGSVGTVEVKKPLNPDLREFDEAAVNAVKQWKFAPLTDNYEDSVSYKLIIPVRFNSEQIIPEMSTTQIPLKNENVPNAQFIAFEEPPKLIKSVPPVYPEFARKHGVQGEVLLQVEILTDGSVGVIQIKKSLLAGPGGLDEAAINAVKQWIFSPAKSDGKPINSWETFPIKFNLN